MRSSFIACLLLVAATLPTAAQSSGKPRSEADRREEITSDATYEKTKALAEAGRKRQAAENARTLDLWTRWIYAVCIGCGVAEPKNIRVVHTTPARVLAGIPAAEDDARERAITHRNRRSRSVSRTRRAPVVIAQAAREAPV
jgi:hypothetical protein